mmetsp:Transcript_25941/g.70141  ORF Transcript_25941/g.70141 Transcript_25941/m.70141 type:complete len:316 (-) Transcript_25941:52-999(-)
MMMTPAPQMDWALAGVPRMSHCHVKEKTISSVASTLTGAASRRCRAMVMRSCATKETIAPAPMTIQICRGTPVGTMGALSAGASSREKKDMLKPYQPIETAAGRRSPMRRVATITSARVTAPASAHAVPTALSLMSPSGVTEFSWAPLAISATPTKAKQAAATLRRVTGSRSQKYERPAVQMGAVKTRLVASPIGMRAKAEKMNAMAAQPITCRKATRARKARSRLCGAQNIARRQRSRLITRTKAAERRTSPTKKLSWSVVKPASLLTRTAVPWAEKSRAAHTTQSTPSALGDDLPWSLPPSSSAGSLNACWMP